MPDLEDRVAALEELLLHPPQWIFQPPPPLTEAQETELREAIGEAARLGPSAHRILPPPRALTPDQVRYLLRECVTAVKPGETLVIQERNWTPNQVREIQRWLDGERDSGRIGFKVLAIIGEELAIAEPEAAPGAA